MQPMTVERKSSKSTASKDSSRWLGSLKLRSMTIMLPLTFLLLLSAYSVIAVRGFSTIPTTVRGEKNRRSTSTALLAGLFGEQTKVKNQNNTYISPTSDWQIYVDQSRPSLDRGGGSIFDAFFSLCDISVHDFDMDKNEAVEVQVIPAILPKPASGGKGPWIRCIWNTNNKKNLVRPSPNLDVSNVDSVEKVYRVLTTHLGVKNISIEACKCLKWKYKGNTYLESGEIKSAIDAYNQALSVCEEFSASSSNSDSAGTKSYNSIVLKQQEGIILLLRASAFLQQAQSHKEALQSAIAEDGTKLPSSEILQSLLSEALSPLPATFSPESSFENELENGENAENGGDDAADKGSNVTLNGSSEDGDEDLASSPSLSHLDSAKSEAKNNDNDPQTAVRLSVMRKLQTNGSLRKAQLRKIKYRHGLYQTSLLQATRDSLRATEVLPSYPAAWLQAGELLSDLWKIKESKQYYEKAFSIDQSLKEDVTSVLQDLDARQELVDRARGNKEWPEDSLQLALDIAG